MSLGYCERQPDFHGSWPLLDLCYRVRSGILKTRACTLICHLIQRKFEFLGSLLGAMCLKTLDSQFVFLCSTVPHWPWLEECGVAD